MSAAWMDFAFGARNPSPRIGRRRRPSCHLIELLVTNWKVLLDGERR